MKYQLPLTLDNGHGELVTFTKLENEANGEKLFFEAVIQPNSGPVEHIHLKQDEYFEVVNGQLSYTIGNEPAKTLIKGQNIFLPKGVPHKFENTGNEALEFKGWVQPANNFVFFIATLFESMKHQKNPQPSPLDGAFLVTRYASEYRLTEIPYFVRKVVMPLTYFVGSLLGKYNKYKNAPSPK